MDPHLLIVDDDERIRSLLQQFLVQSDYLVSIAEDAEQARTLLFAIEFAGDSKESNKYCCS